MTKSWNGDRADQMIANDLGELLGKIDKKTYQRETCDKAFFSNFEGALPAVAGSEWYVKKEVVGLPGFSNQKGKGSPRVVLLVDDETATQTAYFSPDHYAKFEDLAPKFFVNAESFRKLFAK